MKSENWIKKRIANIESDMAEQVKRGMEKGWPIAFWDMNCVERAVLRKINEAMLNQFSVC